MSISSAELDVELESNILFQPRSQIKWLYWNENKN